MALEQRDGATQAITAPVGGAFVMVVCGGTAYAHPRKASFYEATHFEVHLLGPNGHVTPQSLGINGLSVYWRGMGEAHWVDVPDYIPGPKTQYARREWARYAGTWVPRAAVTDMVRRMRGD